jgi:hypothetical protein
MKLLEAGQQANVGLVLFIAFRGCRMLNPRLFFELGKAYQDQEEPHPAAGGAVLRLNASTGGNRGVNIVHTLGLGPGNTVLGLLRTPHVSAGSQCLQGIECSSSPTSGTVFPQVKGHLTVCC